MCFYYQQYESKRRCRSGEGNEYMNTHIIYVILISSVFLFTRLRLEETSLQKTREKKTTQKYVFFLRYFSTIFERKMYKINKTFYEFVFVSILCHCCCCCLFPSIFYMFFYVILHCKA